MRENSSKNSLKTDKSETWKFPLSDEIDLSYSALISNPNSLLSKKITEMLIRGGLSVFFDSPVADLSQYSSILPENPLLNFPSTPSEEIYSRNFRYCVLLLNTLDGTDLLYHHLNALPLDTRKIIIVPQDLGSQKIRELAKQFRSRIVVVPPGFSHFPENFSHSLYFKILFAFGNNSILMINPADTSTFAIASFSSLASEILKTLFTRSKESVYFLIPRPVNLATTIALLQNRLPPSETSPIIFDSHAPLLNNQQPTPPGEFWTPKMSVEQALQETLAEVTPYQKAPLSPEPGPQTSAKEFSPPHHLHPYTPLQNTNQKKNNPPLKHSHLKIVSVLFISLAALFLTLFAFLGFTLWENYLSLELVSSNPSQTISSLIYAQRSLSNLIFLNQLLSILKGPFYSLGLADLHRQLSVQISSFETFDYAQISALRLLKDSEIIISQKTYSPQNAFTLSSDISETTNNLDLVQLALNSDASWLEKLPLLGSKIKNLNNSLTTFRTTLTHGQQLLSSLPQIFAFDRPRTYLLLFQNNMELRPTGGFIGSYGLLTVNHGKITGLTIKDVYAADGQLHGHVDPPAPIKQVLGEASWTLRDSNWDPDFPTSALRAQWFLEHETGDTVDGTIAITLQLAQRLLAVTGPIDIPDYQETISQDNLFARAQYHSEANFFPGSTQKKDFLAAVANALYTKLSSSTRAKLPQLLIVLQQAIDSRDIQVFSNDQTLQQALTKTQVTGTLTSPRNCYSSNCIEDFLFPVDANLGINKDNFAIQKQFLDVIAINTPGQITHQLSLNITNSASSDIWPLGRYKTYLRFYIPPGSVINRYTLTNLTTGQTLFPTNFDHFQDHNFGVVGFPFEVPVKQSLRLTVSYTLPKLLATNLNGIYFLSLHKQAGTGKDHYSISITFPPSSLAIPSFLNQSPSLETFALSNAVRYNLSLSSDETLRLDLNPNH